MNKEDLKKLGIEDEDLIQKVIVLHGKDIEAHKSNLSTAQAEVDGLKKQLSEANSAIEGFKKLDVNAIQKAADEWKAKAEQAQKDADAQIGKMKFDYALSGALTGAKAKNVKAVRALLDESALKLTEDGSIVGLSDQLEKLKKDNDFLFTPEEDPNQKPKPKFADGSGQETVIGDKVLEAARKAAGLQTQE